MVNESGIIVNLLAQLCEPVFQVCVFLHELLVVAFQPEYLAVFQFRVLLILAFELAELTVDLIQILEQLLLLLFTLAFPSDDLVQILLLDLRFDLHLQLGLAVLAAVLQIYQLLSKFNIFTLLLLVLLEELPPFNF